MVSTSAITTSLIQYDAPSKLARYSHSSATRLVSTVRASFSPAQPGRAETRPFPKEHRLRMLPQSLLVLAAGMTPTLLLLRPWREQLP